MLRDKEGIDTFCRRSHGQWADMRRGAALKSNSRTPDGGSALEIDHTLQSLGGLL